jgi:hypothetical protein
MACGVFGLGSRRTGDDGQCHQYQTSDDEYDGFHHLCLSGTTTGGSIGRLPP